MFEELFYHLILSMYDILTIKNIKDLNEYEANNPEHNDETIRSQLFSDGLSQMIKNDPLYNENDDDHIKIIAKLLKMFNNDE